jgi:hypothetical protein
MRFPVSFSLARERFIEVWLRRRNGKCPAADAETPLL